MDEETLNLMDLYRIIIKRKILIISVLLLATIIGAIITYTRPIAFEAEATLRITPPPTESAFFPVINGYNRQTILTYAEIIKSRTVSQALVDKIEVDKAHKPSYESMRRNITVQLVKDTELIKVKVKASSAQEAQYFTNTLADMLVRYQKEPGLNAVIQSVDIQLIDPAVKPNNPIGQSKKHIIVIAAIFGTFIGIGLAFALEYKNSNIKNSIA